MLSLKKTYYKLRKPLMLLTAFIFIISSFAGGTHDCLCSDVVEFKQEEKSCCNMEKECSLSENEEGSACRGNHDCNDCNICSITKQETEQPVNVTGNTAVKTELNRDNGGLTSSASEDFPEYRTCTQLLHNIHSRIFISVSNLRI